MSSPETIFVTGGSGFVGRQIVRRLVEDGYRVRTLMRRPPETPPHPSVELIPGDLTRPDGYETALRGVAAVVHAALTDTYSHDLEATSELRNRSARAGVRKFLHLSTISIYGTPPDGTITEDTPPVRVKEPYAETKLAIEERLRQSSTMAETVILRLGCVYGPGGGWWTDGLLNLMKQGRVIQVNHGSGSANLIHVWDIAALVPLLLARANSTFDIFNVTDGAPVAWSRYFSELEKLLGRRATVSMDAEAARAYSKKWLQASLPRRIWRKVQGKRFVHPLDDRAIAGYASRATYSNQKACRLVGFRPTYTLETGMKTVGRASGAASGL